MGDVFIKRAVWDEKWDPEGNFIKPERIFIVGRHIIKIKSYTNNDDATVETPGLEMFTSTDSKRWYKTFINEDALDSFEGNCRQLSDSDIAKLLITDKLDIKLLTGKYKCENLS